MVIKSKDGVKFLLTKDILEETEHSSNPTLLFSATREQVKAALNQGWIYLNARNPNFKEKKPRQFSFHPFTFSQSTHSIGCTDFSKATFQKILKTMGLNVRKAA